MCEVSFTVGSNTLKTTNVTCLVGSKKCDVPVTSILIGGRTRGASMDATAY
jgi:hypothetical protein